MVTKLIGQYKKNIIKFKKFTKKYFLNFFFIQSTAILISTPILVLWGKQISLLSFLGNLIFLPFLFLFLIFSSLIFFTEIINIPNGFLIKVLNKITVYWESILQISDKNWMIGFQLNYLLLITGIIIILLILIQRPKYIRNKTIIFTFLAISFFNIIYVYNNQTKQVDLNQKLLIQKDIYGKIHITDNGFFNRKKSVKKAIEFDIQPRMIKDFGTTNINTYTITNPSQNSFKAAVKACKLLNVKAISLPYFDKKLSKADWYHFFRMKEKLQESNVKFLRKRKLNN